MARVVALIPDLMFASKVQAMLAGAGHDVHVVATDLDRWVDDGADALLVDLVSAEDAGIAALDRVRAARGDTAVPPSLAVYSHVDAETRGRATEAGFDLVVPRSRMVREGAALIERLIGA